MNYSNQHHTIASRLLYLAEELTAGCDAEFDFHQEELEREFAELRMQLGHHECGRPSCTF